METDMEDGQIRRICGCTGTHQWFNLEETHFGLIAVCENCGDRFMYKEYPVVDFDDRIFAYCDGCEAKIPPDEYDEFDGFCEVCWDKIQAERERGL